MADDMTLDVSEPQVLAYYGADPHVRWHHRLLLVRVSPGRWVASSPDFDLEILDLNTQRHRILSRRSPLPQDVINDVYIFDPISKRDLEKLKREAKTMALVLGDGEVTGEEERAWIFSDPSSEHLGKLVGHDKLQSAVTLGDRGLIEHEGKIEGISEVSVAEVGSIVEQIKGTQGDLRVLGLHVGADKKRLLLFKDAFPLFKESTFSDWVFTGPRAVKEFLGSIYESGTDLGGYHLQWVKNSNVNPHSSVCHEHRNLMESLRLAVTRDQLDVTCLMSMELLVRRVILLEVAVSRNANSPDFSGLEVLMENPLSEGGAAVTRQLDEWVTSRLKEQAKIAKNARLFREEASMRARAGRGAGGDEPEPSWRKRNKPKAKAKGSAGASNTGAGDN